MPPPSSSPQSQQQQSPSSSSSTSIRINNKELEEYDVETTTTASPKNSSQNSSSNTTTNSSNTTTTTSIIDDLKSITDTAALTHYLTHDLKHKLWLTIKQLPTYVQLYLLLTVIIHMLRYIPSFYHFSQQYMLYQPSTLFTNYRLYTPFTSILLNSNVMMLVLNSFGIVFVFSFTVQNHFLSEEKLLIFLWWNLVFGMVVSTVMWSLAWHLTLDERLLGASFPGATCLLNSMNLLLAHFSPESSLPIHRKLRIRHLPGLYLMLLVPGTWLFVSWEESMQCFNGLVGGWTVIRYVWGEKRDQWRFTKVFFPDQFWALLGMRAHTATVTSSSLLNGTNSYWFDLDQNDIATSSTSTSTSGVTIGGTDGATASNDTSSSSNPQETSSVSSAVSTAAVSSKRLLGEQALMEKMRRKENEQKGTHGSSSSLSS